MGINYYKEFATSKTHAALGVGIAAAFAAANPLLLMCASAGYILGWVYLPTSKFFTAQVQGKLEGAQKAAQAAELAGFQARRNALLERLSGDNRARYDNLTRTCGEVAGNTPGNALINGKLQELLWTYLKMLLMQQGIQTYLAETDESVLERNLADVEEELKTLGADKQRLRSSKESLRDTLSQHRKSVADAKENLLVLNSELTRLEHEIQLLRADAIANRSSDVLSAKINASVESLQQSKSILQTMSNVEELALDIPAQAASLDFEIPDAVPPPLPARTRTRIK